MKPPHKTGVLARWIARSTGFTTSAYSPALTAKDDSVVRYSVLHGNEQLFASRYRLILPTEEELRQELIREQRLIEERNEALKSAPKDD